MADESGEKTHSRHSSNELSAAETIVGHEKDAAGQTPQSNEFPSVEKPDAKLVKAEESQDDPLDHLPESEREILKRQLDVPPIKMNYLILYRYATPTDLII